MTPMVCGSFRHARPETPPRNRQYAVGGSCDMCGGPLAIVEAYDPATNTFRTMTSPIVVERAMCANAASQPGLFWAAGTVATGTPIP
jgi:hypothetical protein